jgi:hypothetical protein
MIAGEGIVGILLALITILGFAGVIDVSGFINLPPVLNDILGIAFFAVIILTLVAFTKVKKNKN